MIGDFRFELDPPETGIIVEMRLIDDVPHGSVKITDDLHDKCTANGLPRTNEEMMRLPFALANAVIVAGLCQSALCLTGDSHAWPASWGRLKTSN